MKKLQVFWGKNSQNKIITFIIVLMLSCCILAACITAGMAVWLLFSDTPTAPISSPQIPTEPPTAIPTIDSTSQELEYATALTKIVEESLTL